MARYTNAQFIDFENMLHIQPTASEYFGPLCTWLPSAAIWIVTTRHLLTDGFHFPRILLLGQVVTALVIKFAIQRRQSQHRDEDVLARPIWVTFACIFAYIAAIQVALLFLPQALLRMRNTTLLTMILTIALDAAFVADGLKYNAAFAWTFTIRFLSVVPSLVVLFLDENLLSGGLMGEAPCMIVLGCFLGAKVLRHIYALKQSSPMCAYGWEAHSWALFLSIPVIIWSWYGKERLNMGDFSLDGRWTLLLINNLSGAIALSGGLLFQAMDVDAVYATAENLRGHLKFDQISSLILVALVELDNQFAEVRPTSTTLTQWLAYLIISLALWKSTEVQLSDEESGLDVSLGGERLDDVDSSYQPLPQDQRVYTKRKLHARIYLCVGAFALLLATLWWHQPTAPVTQQIDVTYESDLDIVVARYNEPIANAVSAAQSFLQQSNVVGLRSRIIIYNKGELDADEFEHIISDSPWKDNITVRDRRNVGREGETYLSHILDEWDDLAHHTVFMQGEPHELDQATVRFRDYMVSETAFLSLSYVGNFCSDCDRCGDLGGWQPEEGLLRTIFSQSNPESQCRDLSLTYRGQFVLSRASATAIDRDVLARLRDRTIDDPEFGYTLERMWGVVWRCPRISAKCPSLVSGQIGKIAGVGDCQCLEECGVVPPPARQREVG